MQKLDGMNIIAHLKVQNLRTTIKTITTIALQSYYFKCSENAKTRKNWEASYIAKWKPDLNKKKVWKTSLIQKLYYIDQLMV